MFSRAIHSILVLYATFFPTCLATDATYAFSLLFNLTNDAIAGIKAGTSGYPGVAFDVDAGQQVVIVNTVSQINASAPTASIATVQSQWNTAETGTTTSPSSIISTAPAISTDVSELLTVIVNAITQTGQQLATNNATFVGNATVPMDVSYALWLDRLPTLSSTLIAAGKSYHTYLNGPIFVCIRNLAKGMHDLTRALVSSDVVSRTSLIRSIHVGSTLSDAQTAWDKVGNLPG